MFVLRLAHRIVFDWPRGRFLGFLFAAMVVKTGVWHIPNIADSIAVARNPFVASTSDRVAQYLTTSWLAPFLAWLVGATGEAAFVLMHLGYVLAFTMLFLVLTFSRLPEREARIAVVIFAALPVSATAYFWISNDGLTLLLLLGLLALQRQPLLAGLVGVALGMQHFEQAAFGLAALAVAAFATVRIGGGEVYPWRTAAAGLAGVIAGKLLLMGVFSASGMSISGREGWFLANWRMLQEQFWLHAQVILWSVLGLGWLVAMRYADRGRETIPFFVCLFGLLPLLTLVDDQTRVLAIVTFPLVFAFWLNQRSFLEALANTEAAGLFLLWLVMPWSWVWGGEPKWSVLPYGLAYGIGTLTGWYELPAAGLADWPFGRK